MARGGSDIAHMLLDCFFCRLTFAAHAHAQHHLECDGEQQQAAGDAKSRERDPESAEEEIADEGGADKDHAGNDGGAHGDIAARAAGQALGDRKESRRESDRIDHHKQGHKRRYGEVEWHSSSIKAADCPNFSLR